jgi:hypothetical protein
MPLLYIFISLVLFVLIFLWINYLTNNNYIVECFTNNVMSESSKTSHTVNLPLTTTYSCKNFCGPTARCSITGQQCLSDIDCPGCQPYSPPLSKTNSASVPAANDAGKLTVGVSPQYSPLTSGYGTQELVITKDMYSKPASPNFGVDIWSKDFDESKKLFDKRYKPPQLPYMPNYPKRYSLSGDFIEDGPFPSNAPLPKVK